MLNPLCEFSVFFFFWRVCLCACANEDTKVQFFGEGAGLSSVTLSL